MALRLRLGGDPVPISLLCCPYPPFRAAGRQAQGPLCMPLWVGGAGHALGPARLRGDWRLATSL